MNQTLRALAAASLAVLVSWAHAADDPQATLRSQIEKLQWQAGPSKGVLGDKSTITLAQDVKLLGEQHGSRFLELTGNLPSPGTSILASNSWWATFDFVPVGYVKDDEKIDADALLKQIKEQDEPSNEERRKRGMAELHTVGWYVPPHYDTQSKHLEWGLKLHASDSSEPVINYTVRLLGRTGYESVVLVSSPETLDADVASFKATLAGFSFNDGERYAEFKQGDRVAQFGLAALVAGGAAAVAAKAGWWKVLIGFLAASWKLVAAGAVALVAGIGKLVGRKPAR